MCLFVCVVEQDLPILLCTCVGELLKSVIATKYIENDGTLLQS